MNFMDEITKRDDVATTSENTQTPVDTDNLSLAELKALALKEAGEQPQQKESAEQQRDDKGRFKPVQAQEDADEDEGEVVYRTEIDLGDGSGKQVFEAPSEAELIDKLAEAQKHATKKIREQAAELKTLKDKKPAQAQTQDDPDDFVLSQEILSKPTEAVKKAFKKATGLDISEFKTIAERVKAIDQAQTAQDDLAAQQTAAKLFVEAHPEYIANQANGTRLNRAVELLVREAKANGEQVDYQTLLTTAYEDLTASGLLQLKPDDATSNDETDNTTKTARIVRAGSESQPQRVKKSGSSLVSRARATAAPTKTGPTEEELYSMPLHKLRELALQQSK
jgi:hypothetical protein